MYASILGNVSWFAQMSISQTFRRNPGHNVTTIYVAEILDLRKRIHKVLIAHQRRAKSIERIWGFDAGQQSGQGCAQTMSGLKRPASDALECLLKRRPNICQRPREPGVHLTTSFPGN